MKKSHSHDGVFQKFSEKLANVSVGKIKDQFEIDLEELDLLSFLTLPKAFCKYASGIFKNDERLVEVNYPQLFVIIKILSIIA